MPQATVPDKLRPVFVDLLLAIADDKLLLGHCHSNWTGLAPILEEDIAFSSIAQDELAHASSIYGVIAGLVGTTPDQIAFHREPAAYRCASIVEMPDEFDWAKALARQFFCDHFDVLRLKRLSRSAYEPAASLAKRLVREEQVHVQHVDRWIRYLGRGTLESHERMQNGLDAMALRAPMLAEQIENQRQLADAGLYPGNDTDLWQEWAASLSEVAREADLRVALEPPDELAQGGRRGRHADGFAEMLDQMCEVFRIEPDAVW